MIDVSILRKKPEDRIRPVPVFGGEVVLQVLFCGREEMKRIREHAADLVKGGSIAEDAYNLAYGRVALLGWDGLSDAGEPLEVSDASRDLLMLGSAEIRTAVIEAASSLQGATAKN